MDRFCAAFGYRLAAAMGGPYLARLPDTTLQHCEPEVATACARFIEDYERMVSATPMPELPPPAGWRCSFRNRTPA